MKTLRELKKLARAESTSPKIRVALLGDTATQLLVTAIKGDAMDRGYSLDLYEGESNQVERQVMDPTSDFYQFDAEISIIFQSTHKLGEYHSSLPVAKQELLAEERLSFIASLCESPSFANKKLIYFNYPEIEDTVFGSYANKVEFSFSYQVRKLNYELMNLSRQYPNLFICDIAGLQNMLGRQFMFAPNVYMTTEMVLSVNAIPYVASRVVDIIAAIKGQFKKCLILDLDNTVWGGVIGDDGLEGARNDEDHPDTQGTLPVQAGVSVRRPQGHRPGRGHGKPARPCPRPGSGRNPFRAHFRFLAGHGPGA